MALKLLFGSAELPSAFDLSIEEWKTWSIDNGVSSFVGKQIVEWIYCKGVLNPLLFTNIAMTIREKLKNSFMWDLMHIDSRLLSHDGSEKFLLQTKDGLLVEMVLMPSKNRTTLCVSCQVGCKMGCTFCQTGKMGFKRNLSSAEIVGQLLLANALFAERGEECRVTNVVFMGMGEPLDNYEAVVKACLMMIDSKGFNLSKSRVTISTSGLIPAIRKLGSDLPVRLAISLHSADEIKRSEMMPINRAYSLKDLKAALLEYPSPARFGITFEYVMIEGKNDSIEDAKKLVAYVHGLKAKVNLIPVNYFPGVEMKASSMERIARFQKYLSSRSIPAPVRYSRGKDIGGGCGQLAAKRGDELEMDPRVVHRNRRRLPKKNNDNFFSIG